MRTLTDVELTTIYNEEDALNRNITRMCVTDNVEELARMQAVAVARLNNICKTCIERISEREVLGY